MDSQEYQFQKGFDSLKARKNAEKAAEKRRANERQERHSQNRQVEENNEKITIRTNWIEEVPWSILNKILEL